MKASLPRVLVRPALFLASMSPVLAHPGHDDGHELTWELSHLAAYPFATAGCLAVLAAAAWIGVPLLLRHAELVRVQILRTPQLSRRK